MKRLLTIGHSYAVGVNRALAHHMALEGGGDWTVTALAPSSFQGDLQRTSVQPIAAEACVLKTAPVRLDRVPHLMWYGGEVGEVLSGDWDVIHCWEEPYVLAAVQIARATRNPARLVLGTFQNIAKEYPWPFSAFERYTMRRAAGWIAFGQTVHDALRDRVHYRDAPARVIPPGVDLQRFQPDPAAGEATRARIGWSGDAVVVGFLGRFVEPKGLRLLVDALRQSRTPWHALFVGGGPLEGALREFGRDYPGRVHVQTGVAHDDVPAWLNAMTMLCAPSQTTAGWREQFGRMLIEAMACGVPVIASDSGEIPFVVAGSASVVGERDIGAWTTAIDRLAMDGALRADYRRRGLARARERFAWPVVARAHLEFFDALLEGRAG